MAVNPEIIIKKAFNSGVLLFAEGGKLGFQIKDGCDFSNELKAEVKANKASIIKCLEMQESDYATHEVAGIEPCDRTTNEYVLSYAQQRLWLLDQLQGSSAEYNMPVALNVSGRLDLKIAEAAVNRVIARHEPLRTNFAIKGEDAVQVIQSNWTFSIGFHDLTNLDLEVQHQAAQELAMQDSLKPFDLQQDLMLRASYIQLSDNGSKAQGVLLFNMHHIASDGWSMNILVNEFLQQYKSIELKLPNPYKPLTIQYVDYAAWQRQILSNEQLDSQLSYWKNQLQDAPATHALLLDAPRPETKTYQGASIEKQVSLEVLEKLQKVAKDHKMTPFMVVHAALSLVLSRHSNSHDIVVGTAVANRTQAELEPLIGFFVNILALRVNTRCATVSEYLSNVKQVNLSAQANQDIPFDQVVEHCSGSRSGQYTPLVQITFAMNTNEETRLEVPEVEFSSMKSDSAVAKFDLDLKAQTTESGLHFRWEYDTAIFKRETINTLSEHLTQLLTNLINVNDFENTSLAEIEMYSSEESNYLLHNLNDTQVKYPDDQLIHEMFEQNANHDPDRIAVKFQEEQLSYGELNKRANQLAHYLRAQGVKTEDLVGVCVERSIEMIVALLGIIKAGAAYVPLDPNHPQSRIQYMIDDSGLQTVITRSNVSACEQVTVSKKINLDDANITCAIAVQSCTNPDPKQLGLGVNNLIYVLYTSGSTGNPKGVMVEHQSLLNTLRDTAANFKISETSILLQSTSMNFDGGSWVVWVSLIHKACFLICDDSAMYGNSIEESINKHQVTHVMMTPSSAMLLQEDKVDSIQAIIVAGEAFNPQLITKWRYRAELFNAYGPTEASICATLSKLEPDDEAISIGKPLKNTTAFILSETQEQLPIKVVGELYLGGAGLARGYLNRPDLTSEKFVKNPFYDPSSANSSERLYRTGDMVRWLPNGNLEYIGRIDGQIKIRGFRIELGEIENTLSLHPDIQHCIVDVKESAIGSKYLVAYVVSEQTEGEDSQLDDTLRIFLKSKLPEHMVPTHFMWLDRFPLTSNGKVDKSALPEPDLASGVKRYVSPSTETETILCQIWQDLLKIKRIGITDNFFALGGHSLMVVKLVSRLQEKGLSINVQQIFSAETLQQLAEQIDLNCGEFITQSRNSERVIPIGCTKITPDMLPLVELSDDEIERIVTQVPNGAENIEDIYPLGPLQEGILFHNTIDKEHDPFISSTIFKVRDQAGLSNLINALHFILGRYEVLRAAVLWQELSVPVQVICRQVDLPVERISLDSDQDGMDYIQSLCLSSHRMDLSKAPLLRLKVVQVAGQASCFALLQAHHMNLDHVGLEVIYEELMQYFLGKQEQLPKVLPYREFISHTQKNAKISDAEVFFSQKLKGIDGPTAPFNLIDVQGNGSTVDEFDVLVPSEVCKQLRSLAKTINVSPAILFHSAWSLVVAACSNRDDIVFGTVVSGRLQNSVGAERMLGLFMNTLPLRVQLGSISVYKLVKQVQASLNELLPYEQTPLATAQRCAKLPANVPLFSAMLNYRHSSAPTESNDSGVDIGIEMISDRERANYPFSIMVDDYREQFSLKVQVTNNLSAERIAKYMQNALIKIVSGLTENSDQILSLDSILPVDEKAQLLNLGKCDDIHTGKATSALRLFENTVENTPLAEAVQFEDFSISYMELNNKANRLAHYLLEMEVGTGCQVGIFVERSVEMLICILGIMKSGATYVPLDPAHPAERVKYIIDDADVELVLVSNAQVDSPALSGVDLLLMENAGRDPKWLLDYSQINPQVTDVEIKSENIVYILYTSGSTGQPKGVMVPHSALDNYIFYASNNYLSGEVRSSVVSSALSFDATITTLFTPLVSGGTVILLPEGDQTLKLLINYLFDSEARLFKITPAHLDILAQQAIGKNQSSDAVHKIVVGGEQLTTGHLLKWQRTLLPHSHFVNEYGPTESVVGCSTYSVDGVTDNSVKASAVPIGKAINNIELFVLNKQNRLCPRGVTGQLFIGGNSLASGYVNNSILTTEKFIDNPFFNTDGTASSDRLYCTGDLVRWLDDDNLEFVGRVDEQVKIRGFRVELGEVEHKLLGIEDVSEAVVCVDETSSGDKRIVGYIVPSLDIAEENRQIYIDRLREVLNSQLPEYMLPSLFVLLDELPLTTNGKIDRKALPAPYIAVEENYRAPDSDTEILLCEIWQDILGLEEVSVTDNFFNLGGHSLLAMRMLTRLEVEVGVEVSISTLFMYPNVASIAAYIDAVKLMPKSIEENHAELIEEGMI